MPKSGTHAVKWERGT